MAVYIRSIGAWVPERRVTNDELAAKIDTSDEWIRSHTGIGARHLADDRDSTSDLGARAARIALERAGLKATDINLIVFATATQDYTGFPSTACVLAKKIGASGAAAFDISAACSGFIYGLSIADAMLAKTRGNALVVSAEILSRFLDWNDRSTCVLFGDGAGAAVLSWDDSLEPSKGGRGIIHTILHSYGEEYDALTIQNAGYRADAAHRDPTTGIWNGKPAVTMDGRRVYNFAVAENVSLYQDMSAATGISLEAVDWFVPHQANARIISAAASRLKIDESKFFVNIEDYANTSAASVPIALNDMYNKGLLKSGQIIMTVGFGAGLTSGGAVIRW